SGAGGTPSSGGRGTSSGPRRSRCRATWPPAAARPGGGARRAAGGSAPCSAWSPGAGRHDCSWGPWCRTRTSGPVGPGRYGGGVSILDDARDGMDLDIRPQDDLFGHVNGAWLESAEIPSDRSSWGPFVMLADAAEEHVRVIIE